MYMLVTTLVLASTLCLLRALDRPSALRWVLYAGLTILAVYTVYFALFAVFAQVITVAALHCAATTEPRYSRGASASRRWRAWCPGSSPRAPAEPWRRRVLGAAVERREPARRPRAVLHGPPLNTWVTGFAILRTLEVIGDRRRVPGPCALVLNRHGSPEARETRFVPRLAVAIGVACHPRELLSTRSRMGSTSARPGRRCTRCSARDSRPSPGVASPSVPRPSPLWSHRPPLSVTNPETPPAIAAVQRQMAPGDLIAAYPSEYLLVRYYGDHAIDDSSRSLAVNVPWFWGTAVYPPGAVLQSMPMPSPTTRRSVRVRAGRSATPDPGGYSARSTRCWTGVCVTMLTPSGLGASGANST